MIHGVRASLPPGVGLRDPVPFGGARSDPRPSTPSIPESGMLYTVAVVLIILWLLGFLTDAAMGGFIHILLVVAIILILVRLIGGSRR